MNRPKIRVVGAMLERESGRYLITQRSKNASLPLLWEFPGGKVHDGESDDEGLKRELKERLGIDVIVDEEAMFTHHEYDTYTVDFRVFHCKLAHADQDVHHESVNDHRWVTLDEMGQFNFPGADARTLAKLLELDS